MSGDRLTPSRDAITQAINFGRRSRASPGRAEADLAGLRAIRADHRCGVPLAIVQRVGATPGWNAWHGEDDTLGSEGFLEPWPSGRASELQSSCRKRAPRQETRPGHFPRLPVSVVSRPGSVPDLPAYHRCVPHPERTPREPRSPTADATKAPKKKAFTAGAWEEARGLIWTHRKRLALGLLLMLINRLAGFVLPDVDQIPDGRRRRPRALGPAAEAGARGRRAPRSSTPSVRSPTRRFSASPRSARSPTCARTSRRT